MAQRLSQRQLPSFPANCRPKPGAPPSACSPCIKRTVWRVPSSIPGAVRRVLFEHPLVSWRDAFCAATAPESRDSKLALRELQVRNEGLQRDLRRKEKALAEAAALLVLQKKFQALWEDEET